MLAALASPVRQDIVVALEGSRTRTVAEIARQLGRRADALYHHLRALKRSGLVSHEPRASTGGRPGSAWRLCTPAVRLPARVMRGLRSHHAERIVAAMARASLRDYRRALRASRTGGEIRPSATRSTLWLDRDERRGLERTLGRLANRLRAKGPRDRRSPYVITWILTPSTKSAPPTRSRGTRAGERKRRP